VYGLDSAQIDGAVQFKHLSSLTALHRLHVECCSTGDLARQLSGIERLSKLTELALLAKPREAELEPPLHFSKDVASRWAHLTALDRLELQHCTVHPQALTAFSQLQVLALNGARPSKHTHIRDLSDALSRLTRLTNLFAGFRDTKKRTPGDIPITGVG
jgi:hypothetical protein